ncbi:MAG TPA: hypothetical protein VG318_02065 [Actinomycetota bacterium]|nr:hypothetical protein [Actinomycetota bacterium]
MRKAVSVAVASVLLGTTLGAAPATADSWTWRDRGGGRGPLSIQSVNAGHGRYRQPMLTITFDRALDPAAMGRRDFVVVDLELNGRGKTDLLVYFASVRGRLRTFSYEPRWKTWGGGVPFSRPTPRTLRLGLPANYEVGGAAFAVASYSEAAGCGEACWDVVPNRGYLVHDYTAPEFSAMVAPAEFWFEPEVPVWWRARDRGLSGLRDTTLMVSDAGSGKWRRVATRRAPGRSRVVVPGVEGKHMMFQTIARDRAGNVTKSPFVLTRVPYDQANPEGPGTLVGAWLEEERPDAQGGTVHVSTAPGDSLSFPGKGNLFCVILQWVGGPMEATFEVGETSHRLTQSAGDNQYRLPYCITTPEPGETTAKLTVIAGRLGVDGYWAGLEGNWKRDGTLRGPPGPHAHRDHQVARPAFETHGGDPGKLARPRCHRPPGRSSLAAWRRVSCAS